MKRNVDLTLNRDFSDTNISRNKNRAKSKANHIIPWIKGHLLSSLYNNKSYDFYEKYSNVSYTTTNNSKFTVTAINNTNTAIITNTNTIYIDTLPNDTLTTIYNLNHYYPYLESKNDSIINKIIISHGPKSKKTIWGEIERIDPYYDNRCICCMKKIVPWNNICSYCNNKNMKKRHKIPWNIKNDLIIKHIDWKRNSKSNIGFSYVPWDIEDEDLFIRNTIVNAANIARSRLQLNNFNRNIL